MVVVVMMQFHFTDIVRVAVAGHVHVAGEGGIGGSFLKTVGDSLAFFETRFSLKCS